MKAVTRITYRSDTREIGKEPRGGGRGRETPRDAPGHQQLRAHCRRLLQLWHAVPRPGGIRAGPPPAHSSREQHPVSACDCDGIRPVTYVIAASIAECHAHPACDLSMHPFIEWRLEASEGVTSCVSKPKSTCSRP